MNSATPDNGTRKLLTREAASVERNRTAASDPHGVNARYLSLDVLRGLAILLMVLDHVCWLFGDSRIAPDSLRIITRLSMPLFCVLTGYLALASTFKQSRAASSNRGKSRHKRKAKQAVQAGKVSGKSRTRSRKPGRSSSLGLDVVWDELKVPLSSRTRLSWFRLLQVCAASCLLNLVLRSMFDSSKFEILASLVLCYLALALLGRHFCWLAFAWLSFPVDASVQILDYPLSAVASCMAVGTLMRVFRPWAGVGAAVVVAGVLGGALAMGTPLVTPPTVYVLIALPIAALLVACGVRFPMSLAEQNTKHSAGSLRGPASFVWKPLGWIGQHPLKFYVAHYLLLLGFSAFLEAVA
ncbi:MAG: TraX family protein [Pirellulaceae bacterium]